MSKPQVANTKHPMTRRSRRWRVYIAGPLSLGDRQANVRQAVEAGLELARLGYAPLIPHLTNYIDGDDSLGVENWYEIDLAWLQVADAVLRLPGPSKGADEEERLAREWGIPVYYTVTALRTDCPAVDLHLVPAPAVSETARAQGRQPQ